MNKLVVGNLVHRPLRSLISCLAIAIEVIMILSITAILMGKLNGFKTRQNGIGMDMLVRPNTASNLIGMSPAGASIKVADILAKIPHVIVSAPVNIQLTSSLDSIYGIDFKSFNDLVPFTFLSGTPFQGPDDVILDDYAAAGKKVGDSIEILKHNFRICGIVAHGKGGRKFLPITTMGELTSTEGKATAFYLRTEDPPKYQDEIRKAILATPGMNTYTVATAEEFLSSISPDRLPGFNIGLEVVIGIAAVIAGIICLVHPGAGVFAIILGCALWFLLTGVAYLGMARAATPLRIWFGVIGALSLIAFLVLIVEPGVAIATVSIVAGISFLIRGASQLALAWRLGRSR